MNKDTTMLFHHGVPSETVEFLTTSLLKSPKVLSEFGITVRGPKTYQGTMQKALAQLERRAFSDDTREILFARLTQGHEPKRLLLSNRHLFVPTSDIFVGGEFFGTTAQNALRLRGLFPKNRSEFFLEIQNPATFIPNKFKAQTGLTYAKFMRGMNVEDVRWSSVLKKLRAANPKSKITFWCQEDTPANWPMILRAVMGVKVPDLLDGDTDMAERIMPEFAAKRMIGFLQKYPDLSIPQRRTVVSAFLEKSISNETTQEQIDLPDWDQELVQDLTTAYQNDVEQCASIPGVTFIR